MDFKVRRRIGSISQHLKPSILPNSCFGNDEEEQSSKGSPVIIGGMVLDIHAKPAERLRAGTTTPGQEKALTAEWIFQFSSYIGSAPLLMVDANLHPLTLEAACNLAKESNTPVWFEPVSVAKSVRARSILKYVTFISPNETELIAMAEAVSSVDLFNSLKTLEEYEKKMSIEAVYGLFKPAISILLEEGVKFIALTLGSYGVLLCFKEISSFQRIPITCSECNQFTDFDRMGLRERNELLLSNTQKPIVSNNFYAKCQKPGHKDIHLNCVHFPALPVSILSLTGAGDCFVGGTLAALCGGRDIVGSMAFGVAVAKCSVQSELNVPSDFSPTLVSDDAKTVLSLARMIDSLVN